MRNSAFTRGFTLIELLVAVVVTSVLLTSVATLAFALGSANETTGDTSLKQAQIRYTTLRIQELMRKCKLVCSVSDDDIAIWLSDNNNDGQINISELVFIEYGPDKDNLRLCTFPSADDSAIEISSIKAISSNWWSQYSEGTEYTQLLPECSNVDIRLDKSPPHSKFVNILFDITENNIVRQYQINAALRGWTGNLLDEDNNIISDDD